jgi:queuine/archaeosine tRNA-ribosyltransferase
MAQNQAIPFEVSHLFGDKATEPLAHYAELTREPLCLSSAPFYFSDRMQGHLGSAGIHALLHHDQGPIAIDSGGYQNLRDIQRGKKTREFTVEEMIKIYRLCNLKHGDLCVSLDHPILPDVPFPEQMRLIDLNNTRFTTTRDLAPDLAPSLVPVIHGWSERAIQRSIAVAEGWHTIAIGAFFPLFVQNWDKEIMQKFAIIFHLAGTRAFEDSKFWGLGANGANPLHLCAFAGIAMTDSSAWRVKAAMFKIVFSPIDAGGNSRHKDLTEVSVTGNNTAWKTRWTPLRLQYLRDCTCPICNGLSLEERLAALSEGGTTGWIKRCIHNAHCYLDEKRLASELVGTTQYYPYLLRRFARNPKYLRFVKHVHQWGGIRHQMDPTHLLREQGTQSTMERYFRKD